LPHPLLSIKVLLSIYVTFYAVNTFNVSIALLPKSITDVKRPVAAPPNNVANYVFPNTKSLPL
jgi:hypothetical protein